MWREEQNNDVSIYRQRYFDLIIEPTDIAESRDRGATACNQAAALRVPPIRLLEECEILSRTQACERIGIDPNKPAALIQLGSGSNRDIVSIPRSRCVSLHGAFLTMSQAVPIVEQAGYPVEYLPFHVYANVDQKNWNIWLREHLDQVLDFHNPVAVVFDGGNPYAGLIDAILPRNIRLIWIRRGMWREEQNNASFLRILATALMIQTLSPDRGLSRIL